MQATCYVLTAYRWDAENAHNYNVAVLFDEQEALTRAQDYVRYRGGKYGVQVVRFPENEPIAYFPSMAAQNEINPPTEPYYEIVRDVGHEIMFYLLRERELFMSGPDNTIMVSEDIRDNIIDAIGRIEKWKELAEPGEYISTIEDTMSKIIARDVLVCRHEFENNGVCIHCREQPSNSTDLCESRIKTLLGVGNAGKGS